MIGPFRLNRPFGGQSRYTLSRGRSNNRPLTARPLFSSREPNSNARARRLWCCRSGNSVH